MAKAQIVEKVEKVVVLEMSEEEALKLACLLAQQTGSQGLYKVSSAIGSLFHFTHFSPKPYKMVVDQNYTDGWGNPYFAIVKNER